VARACRSTALRGFHRAAYSPWPGHEQAITHHPPCAARGRARHGSVRMLEHRRSLEGAWALIARLLAALLPLSGFIYALRILPDLGIIIYQQQYLAFFLTICLVWTFLVVPPRAAGRGESRVPWYDVILALAAGAAGGYVA